MEEMRQFEVLMASDGRRFLALITTDPTGYWFGFRLIIKELP